MGKNLRQQRRGRGTPRYLVASHRFVGKITYVNMPLETTGTVVDIIHGTGRYAPVAVVDYNNNNRPHLMIANEGVYVGQKVEYGIPANGNIVKLKDVPEGSKICNIELIPRDGGRLCRSSGSFATVIRKDVDKCVVLLPSKVKKIVSTECLATMGSVAASGRTEKPLMKAGKAHYKWKGVGKPYPHVAGVSMNAVNHPFGGQTRPGKAKTVSRHMPPGKKVGSISPKRVGRRKRK
jgi:large subunit ribosomal protein L2